MFKKMMGIAAFSMMVASCSHGPEVKQEAYGNLNNQRTFEYDFPTVWKGIEATFRNYKVVSRDPEDVGELAMRSLQDRKLETDWIYAESRDKYVNYEVNGTPRHKNLQTRVKYKIDAHSQIGGVTVKVQTIEEIERLKSDGSPDGYSGVSDDDVDASRAAEILNKINNSILARIP
jgi:hypothetical protein